MVIDGMTCAACAVWVRAKLDGVTASVNFSTERAYIYASATVSARLQRDTGALKRRPQRRVLELLY